MGVSAKIYLIQGMQKLITCIYYLFQQIDQNINISKNLNTETYKWLING